MEDKGYGNDELPGDWGLHGSTALGEDPVGEKIGAGSEIFGDMDTDGVKGVRFACRVWSDCVSSVLTCGSVLLNRASCVSSGLDITE